MKLTLAIIIVTFIILSCTNKLRLNRSKFYVSERIFEFEKDTYSVLLKRSNDELFLFEKGNFEIFDKIIHLTPQVKLYCDNKREVKFIDGQFFYPCQGTGPDYYNGHYVNKDTILENDPRLIDFRAYNISIEKLLGR